MVESLGYEEVKSRLLELVCRVGKLTMMGNLEFPGLIEFVQVPYLKLRDLQMCRALKVVEEVFGIARAVDEELQARWRTWMELESALAAPRPRNSNHL
jgi:hypothetical protein